MYKLKTAKSVQNVITHLRNSQSLKNKLISRAEQNPTQIKFIFSQEDHIAPESSERGEEVEKPTNKFSNINNAVLLECCVSISCSSLTWRHRYYHTLTTNSLQ